VGAYAVLARDEHRPRLQLALGHPEGLLDPPQPVVHVDDVQWGDDPVELQHPLVLQPAALALERILDLPGLTPPPIDIRSQPGHIGLDHIEAVKRLILVECLEVEHDLRLIIIDFLLRLLVVHLGLEVLVLAVVVVDDIPASRMRGGEGLLDGSLAVDLCPCSVLRRPVDDLQVPDPLHGRPPAVGVPHIGVLHLVKHLVHERNRCFGVKRGKLLSRSVKPCVAAGVPHRVLENLGASAHRLAEDVPVVVGDHLGDIAPAHHRLVGDEDDVLHVELGAHPLAHGREGLAVMGVALEQVIGDGQAPVVHEQAHLDDGGAAVLLARTLPAEAVLVVCLEVVVGHIVEQQRRVPVVQAYHPLVEQLQQVVAPPGEDAQRVVDVVQREVHLVEVLAPALPGGPLGPRGDDPLIHQQFHDGGEVVPASQVLAPVVDELVDAQRMEDPADGGMPYVPHTVIASCVLMERQPPLRIERDGHRPGGLLLLLRPLPCDFLEMGDGVFIEVLKLIDEPDAPDLALPGLAVLPVGLRKVHEYAPVLVLGCSLYEHPDPPVYQGKYTTPQ